MNHDQLLLRAYTLEHKLRRYAARLGRPLSLAQAESLARAAEIFEKRHGALGTSPAENEELADLLSGEVDDAVDTVSYFQALQARLTRRRTTNIDPVDENPVLTVGPERARERVTNETLREDAVDQAFRYGGKL